MRILGGPYRDPERDCSRWHARRHFLTVLVEVGPEILSALQECCCPRYQHARESTKHTVESSEAIPYWTRWSFAEAEWSDAEVRDVNELRLLRDSLIEWAQIYRLNAPWMLDVGLRTLMVFDHGRDLVSFASPPFFDIAQGQAFEFSLPAADPQIMHSSLINALAAFRAAPSVRVKAKARLVAKAYFSNAPHFAYEPWFPLWEGRSRYRKRARLAYQRRHAEAGNHELEKFDDALEQYLNQREESVKKAGFPRALRLYADLDKANRRAMKASELRRFRWLALSCAGHPLSQIADSEGVGLEAVRISNKRTASLLGLP